MRFEEVLPALREGKKITNSSIKNIGYQYIYYEDGTIFNSEDDRWHIIYKKIVESDDWEIVNEKKKVKLRDLTPEQFEKWTKNNCDKYDDYCYGCIFQKVKCINKGKRNDVWYINKDLYSEKFLDQEIEIEEE